MHVRALRETILEGFPGLTCEFTVSGVGPFDRINVAWNYIFDAQESKGLGPCLGGVQERCNGGTFDIILPVNVEALAYSVGLRKIRDIVCCTHIIFLLIKI